MSKLEDQISRLDESRGKLRGRSGGWLIGDGVWSHGIDLMRDLLPNKSYFHVLVLNATGRLPEDRFCKWLEAVYICLSWPDSRIWCNTMGSLAGTARTSALAATMAGVIASESKLYGPRTLIGGVDFIKSCKALSDSGLSIEAALKKLMPKMRSKAHIPGYLRPLADGDIRVEIMREYMQDLGYSLGEHLALAYKVEIYLRANFDQSMNVGGYISAFLADQNYTAEEVVRLFPAMVGSGVTACYVDDVEKEAGHFLPLRCEDVEYTGPPIRSLPKEYKNSR